MINSMKGPELKLKYVLYQAQQRTCQGIPGPIAILLVNDRAFHVQFGGGSIFIDQMMPWRHVCGMFVTLHESSTSGGIYLYDFACDL